MTKRTVHKGQELPLAGEVLNLSRIPIYAYEHYSKIGLNGLLAYVVFSLESANQAATFENITVAAHQMFPGKFSLVGYAQFPDATRIQLVILHLGPKYVGWLVGKKKTGYYLNARGREAAISVSRQLGVPQSDDLATARFNQDNVENRTAVETRIARLCNSTSFNKYVTGDGDQIDDVSLAWDALGLFITADNLTKAETYHQLLEASRKQGNKNAEEFLGWIAKERPHLVGKSSASRQRLAKRRKTGRERS